MSTYKIKCKLFITPYGITCMSNCAHDLKSGKGCTTPAKMSIPQLSVPHLRQPKVTIHGVSLFREKDRGSSPLLAKM